MIPALKRTAEQHVRTLPPVRVPDGGRDTATADLPADLPTRLFH